MAHYGLEMAEQQNSHDGCILGVVAIQLADLQLACAGATADSRIYEIMNWGALAFVLVAVALNLREPSSTHSHVVACMAIALVIMASDNQGAGGAWTQQTVGGMLD